jgi:hypothetical protein
MAVSHISIYGCASAVISTVSLAFAVSVIKRALVAFITVRPRIKDYTIGAVCGIII